MQITLIHHPGAGGADRPDAQALRGLIENAGHDIFYQSADQADWAAALRQPTDLVVVAGGDGTVARVARHLIGTGLTFTALPLGTANNIARSLGLLARPIEAHPGGWATARRLRLDVGAAAGPWGEDHFIEGLGLGLFAWMMPKADASPALARISDTDEALAYAQKMLLRLLEEHHPERINATLDGQDISGDYLMFEALNLPFIGPSLFLAPDAQAGDGLLDVVLVGEGERTTLLDALTEWREGRATPARLPTRRGAHLRIEPTANNVHIDDKIWRAGDSERPSRADIEVKVIPGALECLVPDA